MKSLLSFFAFLVVACWLAVCANSSLPTTVSVANIAVDPSASTTAVAMTEMALRTGMLKTEIHDYVVFRTATLRLADTQYQLVALPGTKWYRYE